MSASFHPWLLEAVRHAKPEVSVPDLALPESLVESWQLIGARCGLSSEQVALRVASHFALNVADFENASEYASTLVPEKLARRYEVMGLREEGRQLVVATSDPTCKEAENLLAFATDRAIRFEIAAPDLMAMRRASLSHSLHGVATQFDLDGAGSPEESSSIVRLVNMMLRQAMEFGASDLHLQPRLKAAVVRLRVDGVIRRVAVVPRGVMQKMINRVKVIAHMDVTDRLIPQDGRASIKLGGKTHDLRISTVPVQGVEKLVIRFLAQLTAPTVAGLNLCEHERDMFEELVMRAQGLVLVAGPTGSGKTTTLYSALSHRNTADVNIVTVEDPVEYRLPRLTQLEVNTKTGMTFAVALRAVLRQDPDIILVGEIRDAETASIAVQASITGHLVLATLHANDAVGVVPRLMDLGLSAPLLAEALAGTMSQRLVRCVCPACGTSDHNPASEQEVWLRQNAGLTTFRRAVGCQACSYTGYKGRSLISQVFVVSDTMRKLLGGNAPFAEIRDHAVSEGMRSLAQSALDRLSEGITTLEEVSSVLGSLLWQDLAMHSKVATPHFKTLKRKKADNISKFMVVMQAGPIREQLVLAIKASGGEATVVESTKEARESVERGLVPCAVIADLEGVTLNNVRATLAFRASMAGAAIPTLVLRSQTNPSLSDPLENQEGVFVVDRSTPGGEIVATLEQALNA